VSNFIFRNISTRKNRYRGTMRTKIIIPLFLLISAHNNSCMLTNPNQKKHVQKICTAQKKIAEEYLKHFILLSLKKNTEIFHEESIGVQRQIILQCKNESPIIKLIPLPQDMQINILANFFENNDKCAAQHFYTMPLEQALKKYNKTSYLKRQKKLPSGMLFLLNDKQENILTKIYQGKTISKSIFFDLIYNLHHHIHIELYKQQKIVNISTGVDPLKALLLTPIKTIWNLPVPTLTLYLNTSKAMAQGMFIYGLLSILLRISSLEQLISAIPDLKTVMKFSVCLPTVLFLLKIMPYMNMVEYYRTTTRIQVSLA